MEAAPLARFRVRGYMYRQSFQRAQLQASGWYPLSQIRHDRFERLPRKFGDQVRPLDFCLLDDRNFYSKFRTLAKDSLSVCPLTDFLRHRLTEL